MRTYRHLQVELPSWAQKELRRLLHGGVQPVRVVLRALALQQLAEGQSPPQVARNLGWSPRAVRQIGWRYCEEGLDRALYERPRPGAVPRMDASQKQRVIAMVCGSPPEGQARWTVRLIAEEAVKRKLVPGVGRETIRVMLQDHELKPWREKNVVRSRTGRRVHRKNGRRPGLV